MATSGIAESHVETAALAWFEELGYECRLGPEVAPDSVTPERNHHGQVILPGRLTAALRRLNPDLPLEAVEEIVRRIERDETPSLVEENRRLHRMIIEGADVQLAQPDGGFRTVQAALVDFEDPERNDWLVTSQFTVIENGRNRRPDLVMFVNGLALAVLELKNPGSENATLESAFNQIQTYKEQVPSLFRANVAAVISDGMLARIGSLTANAERFMPWRTIDGRTTAPTNRPELSVLIEGIFEKRRFLDLLAGFVVFGERDGELVKIVAGYHQFHAVRHAVTETVEASGPAGDRRIGVVWHTQGSGKSLLMAFYAGRVVVDSAMANPTLVIITDRNDLDDQLFSTFAMCQDLIRQAPVQAANRDHLRELLAVPSGGVIFTTLQKFAPDEGSETYPELSDRRNIVVIADEAHRSQYGFKAKFKQKTGEISYGFAKYLRDGLPNASFIGFTGTPIEAEDKSTPAVFGGYIDIYDIHRAVEDGATVPIYYESRLAKIELDEDEKDLLDEEIAEVTEDELAEQQDRIKRKWSQIEALVGTSKRLRLIAEDLIDHFESRLGAMNGKAMIVCMSRRICVDLYAEIVKLRPDWHSDDDDEGMIKVVMTGSAADPASFQPHICNKARARDFAKRAKKANDPLKLVIVRDMWLTGFDAPCMHTMYIDKPMRGHGLMQAIARVNRVFKDKPGGLIVDYIGLAQNLKSALRDYSDGDREQAGIDSAQAIALMLEKCDIVRAMFHGFDYRCGLSGAPAQRLIVLADAVDWVLRMQQQDAARETTEEAKTKARRRFDLAVAALSKAFALAAASEEAEEIRDEVGFFQTIRVVLNKKTAAKAGKTPAQLDAAIQQIVSRAIVSTEIIDVMSAAGIESPDISILSDDFLAEVRNMDRKNLALEALRRLINDEIRAPERKNVVEIRTFSQRLEDAIKRYHNNALTTAQVIEQLIELAKEIQEARQRGDDDGLSLEERAFYAALADNQSAIDVMGDEKLRIIATELLNHLKSNISVDWTERQAARAKLRVLVKRILRRYGYPPDLQDDAVRTVIQQAELYAAEWADKAA